MNYRDLLIVMLLAGPAGSLIGMEELTEAVKELKASDTIEIQLKDGKTTISPETLETVKEASGTLKEMEHDVDFKEIKLLDLSYLDEAQFALVLESIQAIKDGEIEDFLIALNKKNRKQLVSFIDAADYLEISAIMSLFKEILGDGNKMILSIRSKPELVEALLIPKFIKLYKIDLDKGDKYGKTAFILATIRENKDIAELLIKAGADIDKQEKDGRTALIEAIDRHSKDMVEFLVQADVNLEKEDKNGWTALMLATITGNKEIVKLLVQAGADLDKQNKKNNRTALIIAASKGFKDIVELLIKAGANLDKQDKAGMTALIQASVGGFNGIVKSLIDGGADLDKQERDGMTALIWAAYLGRKDTVELLIQAGADPNKKDLDRKTALTWASEKGYKDIVELLIKAEAGTKKPSLQDFLMYLKDLI